MTKFFCLIIFYVAIFWLVPINSSFAQLLVNGDTVYGNEWINYTQNYFRIQIAEDGIYRVSMDALTQVGIPISTIRGDQIQVFWMGKEQRIWVSTDGIFSSNDYIEFYGRKNRGELDVYLYEDGEKSMLNPDYSLVNDTSVFFLTWGSNPGNRFEIIENNLTGNLPPVRPYYLHREKLILQDQHFKPSINTQGVRFSHYVPGEGFGSLENTNHNFDIPTDKPWASGPQPRLSFRMTGNSQNHNVSLEWNNVGKGNFQFFGSEFIDTTIDLLISDIKNNNVVKISTSVSTNDKVRFGSFELVYPRSFSMEKELTAFEIEDARDGVYLEITDFPHQGIAPVLLDLTSGFRLEGVISNDLVRFYVPAGPNHRSLVLFNPEKSINQDILEAIELEPLLSSDANFIIISNPKLYDDGSGNNWVQAYADYRSSPAGGSYRSQIIDIHQLIDQFAYGVDMHPLSIKNFTNYIHKHWSNPEFLFLIGKGLEYELARKHKETYEYLPVYGIPGSDNLLTSRLNSSVPLIPVGRLAVRTPDQVKIYLDKINVMEDQIANAPQTIEDRGWMKKVLHLSGGAGAGELALILNKMNRMAETIKDGFIGAEVLTVQKESSDIIDGSLSESTIQVINRGLILKSYFGHGGVTTTQFQGFEDPFFLANQDRYPVMMALGCHTGNLFIRTVSLGESNTLEPNKGAIGYLATSGLGFLSALDLFGNEWYKTLGEEFYGQGIGKAIQKTIELYNDNTSVGIKTLMQQITLHGDPAFKLAVQDLPDFIIDRESVSLNPEIIETQNDSFFVTFNVVNLGKNTKDSISILFQQKIPGNEIIDLRKIRVNISNYQSSFTISLPIIQDVNIVGVNKILISIDHDLEVEEVNPDGEQNNLLINEFGGNGIEFVIFEAGIIPSYPPNFSILNTDDISLTAITSNPLAANAIYEFQIDTTELFNSPILLTQQLEGRGLIQWDPNVSLVDGAVYYWRIMKVESGITNLWYSSSFVFRPKDKPGWNQSHYFQFLKNDLSAIRYDSTTRTMDFPPAFNNFNIKNVASSNVGTGANGFVNGSRWSDFFRWEIKEGITIVINDPKNQWGFQFNPKPGMYGSVNTTATRIASYPFSVKSPEDRQKIISFIENEIPNQTIVFVYTTQANPNLNLDVDAWQNDSILYNGKNLFNVFEEHGAKLIRNLKNGMTPYIFVFQKNGDAIEEKLATSALEEIAISYALPKASGNGSMQSVLIGPSSKWGELDTDLAWENNDSSAISIIGINRQNQHINLKEIMLPGQNEILEFNATEYPYLQLIYSAKDKVDFNAPNLNHWRVYYEGVPDLAYNFDSEFSEHCDTIKEIDLLDLIIPVVNPTSYPIDSFEIEFTIQDDLNQIIKYQVMVYGLEALKTKEIPVSIPLENLSGVLRITGSLNPRNSFLELYNTNNTFTKCFFFLSDNINPVLDVVFDGRHIMDGEVISTTPLIKILLDDENPIDLSTDSTQFKLFLQDPGNNLTRIDLNSPDIQFHPAKDSSNQANIIFTPTFTQEGIYKLIINGEDDNRNPSGTYDYTISFLIKLENSISNILPYPNPFVNQCRFLYTISGSIIPESLKIVIFSTSGIVVKEITGSELGELQVGTHLTDFVWDGTDEFGDKLANGIYLYRIVTKDSEIENNQLNAYFEKGIGKITILR